MPKEQKYFEKIMAFVVLMIIIGVFVFLIEWEGEYPLIFKISLFVLFIIVCCLNIKSTYEKNQSRDRVYDTLIENG